MSPKNHKKRLLKLIVKLREEVCKLLEDKHIDYPYKNLNEVELDIHHLTQEIEKMELSK